VTSKTHQKQKQKQGIKKNTQTRSDIRPYSSKHHWQRQVKTKINERNQTTEFCVTSSDVQMQNRE